MKKSEVMAQLKADKNERGIKNWNDSCAKKTNLKSFGIGLTKLRKMAKQIGKNPKLAAELWKSSVYDAKIIALLIDDPKVMTMDQVEKQVDQLVGGYLAHVFCSCGAPLTKTPFVKEVADNWMNSKEDIRRSCGFELLHGISKLSNKKAPDDSYFAECIKHIKKSFKDESTSTQLAMGYALIGIGGRSKKLNTAALKVAQKISPIDFDPTGKCKPFDVVKHLTSDHIKKKLGA